MKEKFKYLVACLMIFFLGKSTCLAQSDSDIVDLKVIFRPLLLNDTANKLIAVKPVIGYDVIIYIRFNPAMSNNAKINIKIGQTQNSASLLNQKLKILFHNLAPLPNNRCLHTDSPPDIEFGLIRDNMFYYKTSFTNPGDFDNIKWVTVYTSGTGNQQSIKKYYNIQ